MYKNLVTSVAQFFIDARMAASFLSLSHPSIPAAGSLA
jgi:hypothetical protein